MPAPIAASAPAAARRHPRPRRRAARHPRRLLRAGLDARRARARQLPAPLLEDFCLDGHALGLLPDYGGLRLTRGPRSCASRCAGAPSGSRPRRARAGTSPGAAPSPAAPDPEAAPGRGGAARRRPAGSRGSPAPPPPRPRTRRGRCGSRAMTSRASSFE